MRQSPIAVDGLPRRIYEAAQRTLALTRHNMAVQDWVVAAFHLFMLFRISIAPDSADAQTARRFGTVLLGVTVATMLLVRGEILRSPRTRAFAYRLGAFLPLLLSYFELRTLLPALQPDLLDQELLEIDRALFGVTPAVWFAQFNTRPVVEWFAFFYYSYFGILATVVLPSLFFDRGLRLQSLLAGGMIVCCVGHVTYTFVPGLGPYAHLDFAEPLRGGFFLSLVLNTVDRAGAMLDIFPSLHTAYPTFFALFAFGERHRAPYKYGWPILAFFAANMIIATMLLRWHWAIDVLAGLALAVAAWRLGIRIAQREADRGRRDDRQPVWEPLWPGQRP